MFYLPALPYSKQALQPNISEETLEFHYGKHHQAYVNNLNALVEDSPLASKSLEEIILSKPSQGIFNNAAQCWNHTFYWHSMAPKAGGAPNGKIADRIISSFGSFEAFKEQFSKAAAGQFGSGWAWLAMKDGKLEVMKTPNGENPLVHGAKPLLGVDVWEHSYYIDYRNARPKYLEAWIDNLVNWEYVEQMFAAA